MPGPDELRIFAELLDRLGAPYMVTGATAAILYGQPRVTNDLDVVLALDEASVRVLPQVFDEATFYLPPESVIRTERGRRLRGHFNVIHHDSGYKADIYLVGEDPLHAWALPRRRRLAWDETFALDVAPPEYVVLRKLEYYREGGSAKHPDDIRAICDITGVDRQLLDPWLEKLGLRGVWAEITTR